MEEIYKKNGLQRRRYKVKGLSASKTINFELIIAKNDIFIGENALTNIRTTESDGSLNLHLETADRLQKYLITFTEDRLYFFGAASINGEEYTIEGETEAIFKTILDGKSGATFTMGTSWFGEAIFPYYYLDQNDITEFTAATVDYATWVTNVQKEASTLEIKPISFNINIDYCGETFEGKMKIGENTFSWTGERIEEDI